MTHKAAAKPRWPPFGDRTEHGQARDGSLHGPARLSVPDATLAEVIPPQVQEVLDRYGLQALEHEPGSTPTAPTAAATLGVEVGQIAKSILLKAKDGSFHLVVCSGDQRLDNKRLRLTLGVKTRMATAAETLEVTGFRVGGVCPFGVEGVEIWADRGLRRFETIYPAAGTDASGVPMTFDQLCEISGATACDVAG